MRVFESDVVPSWVVRQCVRRGAIKRRTRSSGGKHGKVLWVCDHNHNQESRDAKELGVYVAPEELALACAVRECVG